MKCPECGEANSTVVETRPFMDVFLRRRRKCFNNHLFNTYEVTRSVVRLDVAAKVKRGHAARVKAWARRLAVLLSNKPSSALAKELGLHDSSVRRIRRASRERDT